MGRTVLAIALIVVAVAASCSASQPSTPVPSGRALTTAELKIRLIDQFGPLWYCDPDLYPVARADQAASRRRTSRRPRPTPTGSPP